MLDRNIQRKKSQLTALIHILTLKQLAGLPASKLEFICDNYVVHSVHPLQLRVETRSGL